MRSTLRSLAVCSVLFAAAACTGGADDFSEVDVEGSSGKEDSQWHPTEMGSLTLNDQKYGQLETWSKGYHVYKFEGRRGWYQRFQLESRDFQTYLRVTTPSGKKLIERGDTLHPIDEVYFSVLDLEMTESGVYTVLATSIRNMGLFPFGTTEGSYQIHTEGDVECEADGDGHECPSGFACIPDNPYNIGICQRATP
jgi:hypothetical protein